MAADGSLAAPSIPDPLLEVLLELGSAHERKYVEHLNAAGFELVEIEGFDVTASAVTQTIEAMQRGAEAIVQGALSHDGWSGRIDALLRVEAPSVFGSWSYEAVETKLARATKAATILQLCFYSDLLTEAQGKAPERMHVVMPWSDFRPQHYRYADYSAYYRYVKQSLKSSVQGPDLGETYPDPKDHCDICRWRIVCAQRRREDDHPSLVAGISKLQINELQRNEISTMKHLSRMPLPLEWEPDRGSGQGYSRVREQARLQVEARESGDRKFELLPVEAGFGLTRLPRPSQSDIFLDLEGDQFVGEHGIEYLFGYVAKDESGKVEYYSEWAFTRDEEKIAFENFVDFVIARWKNDPDLHIYHYAPYEPGALKRLMGRYATREDEVDQMLRAGLFVDLYQIVRRGLRASVESYSIKRLEPFYGFERQVPLEQADIALTAMRANLQRGSADSISGEMKSEVLAYNRDDCYSAAQLREWLEELRTKLVEAGSECPRPVGGDGSPSERIGEWQERLNELIERLAGDVSPDPENRNDDQQARWILANLLDWHRREEKAGWWEYFRLADLTVDDLVDERAGLSGLLYVRGAGGTAAAPIHRYKFPPQETELRGDEDLHLLGKRRLGKLQSISVADRTVDIKKRRDSADLHPEAFFAHTYVNTQVLREALFRLGEFVAENGLLREGQYQAARDLLLRIRPRIGSEPLHLDEETTVEAATRLCRHLAPGIFAIQGPPGAGKTFTGARMICELVRLGKKVGITANSHKVIRNLIDEVIRQAEEHRVELRCCQKVSQRAEDVPGLSTVTSNEKLIEALSRTGVVGAGTVWFWAREDAADIVDALFVDEAAQMSLANVLAASQAAKTVVLIGDPQQLDQPMQGTHPDGTGVSAFDHLLGGEQTISLDRGLFLEETWRLHPEICAYTSELFYENKLSSRNGLEKQIIRSNGSVTGSGLRILSVHHEGNQNSSPEEAAAVSELVKEILETDTSWIDRDGVERNVDLEDIVIIAPYNAQVFEIQQRLPSGARVGTVDKFQGQEAPIAIYSTATSSHSDAPRGMEFLYSLNRLNVATSRAKCLSIMVSSPEIFKAKCHTPRQMQLANAFCRYVERAGYLDLSEISVT